MKIPGLFESKNLYLMSDLHINHFNVIHHDNRPFENLDEMHSFIRGEFEKLGPDDILFDLGDLFWSVGADRCEKCLNNIKVGHFYKILGNHDKYNLYAGPQKRLAKYFDAIGDIMDIEVQDSSGKRWACVLSHYPILSWNHKFHGSIMIHGHCHGNIDDYNKSSKDLRIDVGFSGSLAKRIGSFLIPIEEVFNEIKLKTGGLLPQQYLKENAYHNEIE